MGLSALQCTIHKECQVGFWSTMPWEPISGQAALLVGRAGMVHSAPAQHQKPFATARPLLSIEATWVAAPASLLQSSLLLLLRRATAAAAGERRIYRRKANREATGRRQEGACAAFPFPPLLHGSLERSMIYSCRSRGTLMLESSEISFLGFGRRQSASPPAEG